MNTTKLALVAGEPTKSRGRPRRNTNQHVADRLLEAADVLLRSQSHFDLTEQTIANAAGINKAMIHYYFGGKDGLLFELIRTHTNKWGKLMQSLETFDRASPQPVTRCIFRTLTDIYFSKPWVTGILISEFARGDSTIKQLYQANSGVQVLTRLRQIVGKLVELGIYAPGTNVEHVASSMLFLVTGAPMLAQFSINDGIVFDEYKSDKWVDYLTAMFEYHLAATQSKTAISSLQSVTAN